MIDGRIKIASCTIKHFVLTAICMLFLINGGRGQDVHFSQFYQVPLMVNPALTGVFNGEFRAFVNYKNQWKLLNSAYQTSALSCDTKFLKKKWKNTYLGGGLFIFNDKAGDFNLKTTQLNLSLSGVVTLNDHHLVSVGLQGGFAQKSINIDNPRTNSQYYNNAYHSDAPSGETGSYDPYAFGDFSAGLAWTYSKEELNMSSNDELGLNAGIAFYHVNKPKQKFIIDDVEKLYAKLAIHGSGYVGTKGTKTAFLPSVLAYIQGPTTETNVGAMIRYRIKEDSRYTGFIKETSVFLGCHYRVGDAIIPSFMFIMADYTLAVSYDINISKLRTASDGRGGLEISLRYISPKPLIRGKSRGAKSGGALF